MSFDPTLFGQEMAAIIKAAIDPMMPRIQAISEAMEAIKAENAALKAQIEAMPTPKDGKDADEEAIGKKITADLEVALKGWLDARLLEAKDELKSCEPEGLKATVDSAVSEAVKSIPAPKDGKDGEKGEKGEDGAGIADLLIDRDGALVATYTDGRMKSLGRVVGEDGKDGENGKDGLSLESFAMEYDAQSHEIVLEARAAGEKKSVRFPAGGIRAAGYWRENSAVKAGEAWTHDGCLWIARRDTSAKPEAKSEDWQLAARKGRDGEDGKRVVVQADPGPIKVGGNDSN